MIQMLPHPKTPWREGMPVTNRLLRVACLLLCLLGVGMPAAGLNVVTDSSTNANAAVAWCATERDVGLAQVLVGACAPEPVKSSDLARGYDHRAFWLRLTLTNGGAQPLERWLSVGHSRLEEVSLFVPVAGGDWQRSEVGIRTPLAQRQGVARAYGVFQLLLPAGSQQTVWLRVASRTIIDLSTTLWVPAAYLEVADLRQFSLTLMLGGLLMTLLLSALMFILTREQPYLLFALAMVGVALVTGFLSGTLQRYVWPVDTPMLLEMLPLGALLVVATYVACLHALLPGLRQYRWPYRVFAAMVLLTLAGLLWAIGVDYTAGARVWLSTLAGTMVLALWLAFLAWRDGSRAAGIWLLSFLFPAIPELLNFGASLGLLPFFQAEIVLLSWAFLMTTPLIFVSFFQRSREVQANLSRVKEENLAKIAFLAQMSHELRTPMNIVLGNAQLLARPGGQALWTHGIDNILQSGRHLLAMLDQILDYARGEAGKLMIEPAPVNWSAFLHTMAKNARVLALVNRNKFVLQVSGEPLSGVLLDEARVRQVLDNLLANAARHTRDGEIRLECVVGRLNYAGMLSLHFAVIDTGEGIDLADQERVFLPFVRGHSAFAPNSESGGMGLAISKQLVEAMDGQLTLQSVPGAGACLRVWLPAALATTPVPAPQELTFVGYSGPQQVILVVDDDANSRKLLLSLLQDCGFSVLQAASGQAAAELLASLDTSPQRMDLVLTDQFMADGDGWMVLQTVSSRWPEVPVVLTSAAPPERPASFPKQLDFAAHFLKPLDHAELLQCIGELRGLQWTLAEPHIAGLQTPGQADSPTVDDWALDDADAQALLQMVQAGRITDIMDWAKALQARVPSSASFATQVHEAAQTLDVAALHTLTGMLT